MSLASLLCPHLLLLQSAGPPQARNTRTGGTRQSQKQLALDKVSAYLYLAQGKTNDIRGGVCKYKV